MRREKKSIDIKNHGIIFGKGNIPVMDLHSLEANPKNEPTAPSCPNVSSHFAKLSKLRGCLQ
jgi:hypothetical protein